jgi:CubicO group peptidase (beta-lactamase class C family)
VDASAAFERIGGYVDRHREDLAAPGLALALTDRDRCLGVVTDGSANIDTREPVREHHRFQIGSISKGFTALAILQQVERGTIGLDDPVTTYLPWFEVRSAFPPITIHHLLSHTAGLVMGTDFTGDAVAEVWALRETETGFAPGERFLYSNVGYKALGLALEAVTGRPWWESVRERVAEPIGMGDVDLVITDRARARQPVGYAGPHADRPWFPRHGWAPSVWFQSGTADGTICATAEELTAYLRLLLAGGGGVVSPASFERMTTPYAVEASTGQTYGYGVRWLPGDPRRYLGHGGGMIGFTALVLVDVEAGFGVASLMNSAFGRHHDLARFALECVAAEAADRPLPAVPDPRDPASVARPGGFEGRFVDEQGVIEIVAEGHRLFLVADGHRAALLPAGAEGSFGVDDPDRDRCVLGLTLEGGTAVRASWGNRLLRREGSLPDPEPGSPPGWAGYPGRYSSWNPWMPGLEVFSRGGELWLAAAGEALADLEGERRLTALDGGSFRVGEEWSPDRIRFDTVVDGRAHRVILNAAPFFRSFES